MAALRQRAVLSFYIYREPRRAKSLHIGVIPRAVDEYWQFREKYPEQPIDQKLGNPVHHIHGGKVPDAKVPVTYGLLLNLAGVLGAQATPERLAEYLDNYLDEPAESDELNTLIDLAVNYARDFIVPELQRRAPTEMEAEALRDLDSELARLPPTVGRGHPDPGLRSRQAPSVREPARLVPGIIRDPARLQPRARAWAASSRFMGSTRVAASSPRHWQPPPRTCEGRRCFHETIGFDCE